MFAPITTSLMAAASAIVATGNPAASLVGAVVFSAWVLSRNTTRRRLTWELLPDRLFLPADGSRPAKVLRIAELAHVTLAPRAIGIRCSWGNEVLVCDDPASFMQWLGLLRSPSLGNLRADTRHSVCCGARDQKLGHKGVAILVADAALFLPAKRSDDVLTFLKVASGELASIAAVLMHLPEERWQGLAPALAEACGGVWVRRADARVNAESALHIDIEAEGVFLKLEFEASQLDQAARAEANRLLAAWAHSNGVTTA